MPRNARHDISKAAKQTPSSKSIRTTVPKSVAEALGIESGDFLHWVLEGSGKNARATVRPLRYEGRRR